MQGESSTELLNTMEGRALLILLLITAGCEVYLRNIIGVTICIYMHSMQGCVPKHMWSLSHEAGSTFPLSRVPIHETHNTAAHPQLHN